MSATTTTFLVLYSPSCSDLGKWIEEDVIRIHFPSLSVLARGEGEEKDFFTEANAVKESVLKAPTDTLVIVAAFFDGLSDSSKEIFGKFRALSVADKRVAVQALNAKKGSHTLKDNAMAVVTSLMNKLDPQTQAYVKGLVVSAATAAAATNALSSSASSNTAAAAAAAASNEAASSSPSQALQKEEAAVELTETALKQRVEEGQGEGCWVVMAESGPAFEEQVAKLKAMAKAIDCGCFAISEVKTLPPAPITATAAGGDSAATATAVGESTATTTTTTTTTTTKTTACTTRSAQEFIVRRAADEHHLHMEMRLAMCGNVDSGKSTLTSVLTRGARDDGRGLARAHVFNHKHEADTGRTSSISCNHLGFDESGEVVNYAKGSGATSYSPEAAAAAAAATAAAIADGSSTSTAHVQINVGGAAAASRLNTLSTATIAERSSKMVTLYDLAGHEKYLKTTVLGMTRSLPDYACIVISANNGIQRMTKEHLGLCLALKLPFFIVVTRIDSTPENIKQETMANILKLLKMPTVRKLPYPIRKRDDVIVSAKNLRNDRITPIFEVSNVTGYGIADLLHFINILPLRKDWHDALAKPKEMIIDSTFFVSGVGTIVGGIITQGTFKVNDTLLLGPDGLGAFRPTQIKSIHVKGLEVSEVSAGNDAALCLKKEKRANIRKGNVLIDPSAHPKAYWQFEGEIVILYHSTTISSNYEPVIHSNTVRQSARILLIDQEVLRTGDKAKVKFHFLYRPEYVKVGQRLIFREGRTKGIGTVTKLLDGVDQTFMQSSRMLHKEVVRETQHKK